MKKIILIAIAAVVATGGIVAAAQKVSQNHSAQQPTVRRIMRRHMMMQRIAKQLDLSQAQIKELKDYRARMKDRVQAIRNSNATKPEKKSEMKALFKSSREHFLSVLSPVQKQKLEAMRAQFRKNHPGVGRDRI